MSGWAFTVLGVPAPQGSHSAFVNPRTGKAIVTQASKRTRPWRKAIMDEAPRGPRLDGPICAYAVFTMPRPKSAPKRLVTPSTRPDLSKLIRAAEDALVDCGLLADDARIAEYRRLAKVWPGYDPDALELPGALLAAVEMAAFNWQSELESLVEQTLSEHRNIKQEAIQ